MNVEFGKNFEKQLKAIPDATLKKGVAAAISSIIAAKNMKEIANLKKMKGHKTAYRVRVGDYRMGFYFEQGTITITTIAHRKDIYSKFP